MPDILSSAKVPKLLPVHEETSDIPDLPFRHGGTAPSASIPTEPLPPPIVHRPSRRIGMLTSVLLLLVTLPLSVYFVSQQRQLADSRSKAAYVTSENKLYIANLDKTSFSVVWKESLPSKGCAMAINATTKKEIKKCDTSLSNMHLVTLTGLDPYLSHTVSAQGAQKVLLHPFFGDGVITGLFDETKPSSRLSKGTVTTKKGQPFQGGFVIVTPILTDRFYFPVADETDPKGEYTVDFSLIAAQNPGPFDAYLIEVVDRMGKTLVEEKVQVGSISASLIPTITVNTQ